MVSPDPEELSVERPFNWGVLVLVDAEVGEIPELPRDGTFGTSSHGLAVAVRHAQDVDLDTTEFGPDDLVPPATVSVRVGPGEHDRADFTCVLEVPSGNLHVGDSEHQDVLHVRPGAYQVTVVVDDVTYAEAVDIRLSLVR